MVNNDLNYIVHDAKVQLYFYIASDILKKIEKIPQPKSSLELRMALYYLSFKDEPSPEFISYNQFVFEIVEV